MHSCGTLCSLIPNSPFHSPALGAVRLVDRAEVDQEDWAIINKWFSDVKAKLSQIPFEIRADYITSRRYTTHAALCAPFSVLLPLSSVKAVCNRSTVASGLTWLR